MQQSNQEEVANGRGPARAEEDRGTGQGTSGAVNLFFYFYFSVQEAGQQEAAERSTTPSDGRVRWNTLAKLGRSSRSPQFSQGVGQEENDGSHTRSRRGKHGLGRGSPMSPARDSRVVVRRQAG